MSAATRTTRTHRLPDPAPRAERGEGRGVTPTDGSAAIEAMFPAKDWYFDPVSRSGVPYDGMRPCSCGSVRFLFVSRIADDRGHVVCEHCYGREDDRYRLRRKHDLIYATLDTRTKEVTATMPVHEVLAFRAKLPKG